MRRKYKLILIICISIFFAYLIYFFNKEDKIYLVSFGDGVSSGETSYNIDGISYNDYLKEYFYSKKLLKEYYSFFANKNITTGEGGMVVTNNKEVYDRARYFKNVCFPLDGPRNYQHEDIGYNYRMSNVVAAIGLAQVEKVDDYRDMRIRNHHLYRKYLADVPGIIFQDGPGDECVDVCWMNTIVIDPIKYGHTKDELIAHLKDNGIDTRLLFTGMHKQKAMLDYGCDCAGEYPVCDWLTENGFYLPSSSSLKEAQIIDICKIIISYNCDV